MLCYVIIVCACHSCNFKVKNEMTWYSVHYRCSKKYHGILQRERLQRRDPDIDHICPLYTVDSQLVVRASPRIQNGLEMRLNSEDQGVDIASFLVHYCLQYWRAPWVAHGLGMRLTVGCKLCCHYSSFHSIILYMLYNKYKIQLKTQIIIYQKDS